MTAGAVLCGGQSRRMGTDKAVVEVDGVAMAERVAEALEPAGCPRWCSSEVTSPLLERFGRPTVADEWPGEGPLGGVLTALRAVGSEAVVVAACDLPSLMPPPFVPWSRRRSSPTPSIDVAVARTGRLEPALAWWSSGSLRPLTDVWT